MYTLPGLFSVAEVKTGMWTCASSKTPTKRSFQHFLKITGGSSISREQACGAHRWLMNAGTWLVCFLRAVRHREVKWDFFDALNLQVFGWLSAQHLEVDTAAWDKPFALVAAEWTIHEVKWNWTGVHQLRQLSLSAPVVCSSCVSTFRLLCWWLLRI